MKKFTTLLCMLLLSLCFVLTGCSGATLTIPTNFETVASNGGFVVGSGNYVYFANAYKESSTLSTKEDNNGKKVAENALKRVQTEGSTSYFKTVKNEDGKLTYENVLNKIAGYQKSNMFVVNEYLYFTSPNVHKNKENAYEFNLSSLFRVKLDGSNFSEILTTETESASFYLTASKQLLVFDDEKIISIDVNNNSTTKTVVAENVKNVVFPKAWEEEISWLYFTTNRAEEDLFSGNILNKVNLQTKEVKEVRKVHGETITLIAQDMGRVFYTVSGGNSDGLYSDDFSSTSSSVRHRTLTSGISDGGDLAYVECANSDYNAFVFMYDGKLYIQLISATGDAQATKITNETTTIQFVNGSYVYYSTANGIYRYSVLDRVEKQISDLADMNETVMDFDGRYVYFYAKTEGQTTEAKYLHRADCYSESIKTECLAELLEDDIVEEDENE